MRGSDEALILDLTSLLRYHSKKLTLSSIMVKTNGICTPAKVGVLKHEIHQAIRQNTRLLKVAIFFGHQPGIYPHLQTRHDDTLQAISK